jgi:hypothetical protein
LVIFNEKDGRYGGKSIFLKGQVIVSPFLSVISILLLTQILFAQSEISPKKNRQIGLVFGFDENYRLLFESKKSATMGDIKSARDRSEKPLLCGRVGIDFWKKGHGKTVLHTGIRLAQQGYFLKKTNDLKWPSELMSGIKDPSLPHSLRLLEKNYFIEIPFSIQFAEKTVKNWHFFAEAGLSNLIYLKTTQILTVGNDEMMTWKREKISPIHFMATASAGIERNLGKSATFFLQPTVRMQFTPLKFGVSVKEFPVNGGVLVGLRRVI